MPAPTRVITDKGRLLQAKIQAGNGLVTLDLTEVLADAGRAADGDLLTLEEAIDPRLNFIFDQKKALDDRAIIRIFLTNQGNPGNPNANPPIPPTPPLLTGFSLQQTCWFAQDPDEGRILYQIDRYETNPDGTGIPYVPALSEYPVTRSITSTIVINGGSGELIIVPIDPQSLASRQSIWDAIEEHNQDPDSHYDLIKSILDRDGVPIYHASPYQDFGIGGSYAYGHLRLSDNVNSELDEEGGTAATPAAIGNVYSTLLEMIQELSDEIEDIREIIAASNPNHPAIINVPATANLLQTITIDWSAGGDPGGLPLTYTLERSVNAGAWTLVADNIAGLSITDTTPNSQASIIYRIRAVNTLGLYSAWMVSSSVALSGVIYGEWWNGSGAARSNNNTIFAGGISGNVFQNTRVNDQVLSYNLNLVESSWTAMSQPRGGVAAATDGNNNILLASGIGVVSANVVGLVERYSAAGVRSTLPALNNPSVSPSGFNGMGVTDGSGNVWFGRNTANPHVNNINRYDVNGIRTDIATTDNNGNGARISTDGTNVVTLGEGSTWREVHRFTPAGVRTHFANLPAARSVFGVAQSGTTIVIAGSANPTDLRHSVLRMNNAGTFTTLANLTGDGSSGISGINDGDSNVLFNTGGFNGNIFVERYTPANVRSTLANLVHTTRQAGAVTDASGNAIFSSGGIQGAEIRIRLTRYNTAGAITGTT